MNADDECNFMDTIQSGTYICTAKQNGTGNSKNFRHECKSKRSEFQVTSKVNVHFAVFADLTLRPKTSSFRCKVPRFSIQLLLKLTDTVYITPTLRRLNKKQYYNVG